MADQATGTGGTAVAEGTAKELLETVKRQISEFEAKKLTELRTQLDAFVNKQKALVETYTAQYPVLKAQWCTQNSQVLTLYDQLKSTHLPSSPQWKKLVNDCICAKKKEVDDLGQTIADRKKGGYGKLELARDGAQQAYDEAKARLDILLALLEKLTAALKVKGEHDQLISTIHQVLMGPEHATALFYFWFKLLPSHRRIMPVPPDLPSDCKVPGEKETPEEICKSVAEASYPQGANTPPETGQTRAQSSAPQGSRLPWLMPPTEYKAALDRAWDAFWKAKNDLAVAEAAFNKTPDDLPTTIKEYAARRKPEALEAVSLACLKEYKPKDLCCGEPKAGQQAGV